MKQEEIEKQIQKLGIIRTSSTRIVEDTTEFMSVDKDDVILERISKIT